MNLIAVVAMTVLALAASRSFAEDSAPSAESKKPVQQSTAVPSPAGTAAQALPVFPLQSPHFADIDDSQDVRDDGTPPGMEIDVAALQDILPALRASTPEHLRANIDKSADFKKVFLHPEQYRGHVVQFDGNVEFLFDTPKTIEQPGEASIVLSRAHVLTSYRLLSTLSLTQPPQGMKVGDPVRVTGVFLQRFAYINREMPGKKLSWTPLIVIQKLEPIAVKEEPETSTAWFVGYIVFALVAVALILTRVAAKRSVVNRANVFRRLRIEREGKDRLFPKAKK